jgi:GNAT superfamily N-acetyltransferase
MGRVRTGRAHAALYVDKKHRGQRIARAALQGALNQIARLGGGHIEAISEVTAGREAQGVGVPVDVQSWVRVNVQGCRRWSGAVEILEMVQTVPARPGSTLMLIAGRSVMRPGCRCARRRPGGGT